MTPETFVVNSPDTLHAIYAEARRGFSRSHRSLAVALEAFSEAENEAATRRIGRLYLACGCAEGAALGALGLIAYGLFALSLGFGSAEAAGLSWWDLPKVVGVFFVSVSIGKLLGLWRARLRLKRELANYMDKVGWPDQSRPTTETGPCGVGGVV